MNIIVVGGIIEKDGKYLLVKENRGRWKGTWNLPAGCLEDQESIIEGACREVFEETGCQTFTIGQEYLYGKLVAIGIWEQAYLKRGSYQRREQNDTDTATYSNPRMSKGEIEHLIVCALYPFCYRVAIGANLIGLDDTCLKERNNRYSQHQRHHKVDGNGDGEILKTIVEHALHRNEERIENGTDTDGGQQHGHEVLTSRLDGGIKRFKTFAKIFQISIDNHNRVVDNHS